MSQDLQSSFIQFLKGRFPALSRPEFDLQSLVSENLLSPHQIELPISVLNAAQEFIAKVFSIRQSSEYIEQLSTEIKNRGLIDPGNKSICMSYDFHLDSASQLKLIEVNTNASFLALGDLMYQFRKIPQPVANFEMDELKNNILEELDLFGQSNLRPEIAIIDEKPSEQRLYIEFLIYKELMREWGFPVEIKDFNELSGLEDFVYNRFTDFYFESDSAQKLRDFFKNKKVCFSPNPFEYLVLADKQRIIEWSQSLQFESLHRFLGQSAELTPENSEQIWADRKMYFLKPLRSFGAKQSFRGGSISRKAFDGLVGQGFIAQEFFPAPEVQLGAGSESFLFKYDLRCYAYQGRLQSVVARLYQGQVTNLRTPGGGFAPVIFK